MQTSTEESQKPLLKDFRDIYEEIIEKLKFQCRCEDYSEEEINYEHTYVSQYFNNNNIEGRYKDIRNLISNKKVIDEIEKIKETRNLENKSLFEGTCIAICDIASILKGSESLISTITLLCVLINGIEHEEKSWCIEDVVIYSALKYMSEIKINNNEFSSDTFPSCFSRDIRAIKNADDRYDLYGVIKALRGYNTVLRTLPDNTKLSELLLNKFGNYHPYLEYLIEGYLSINTNTGYYREQVSRIVEIHQKFVEGNDFSEYGWKQGLYCDLGGEKYQEFIEMDFFDLSFKNSSTIDYDFCNDVEDVIFNGCDYLFHWVLIWDMLKDMYQHTEYPSFKALQKILSITQKCLKEDKPIPNDLLNVLQFDTSKIEGIDWKKNDTFREDLLLEYEDVSTIKECQKALLKLIKEGKTLNEARRILSNPLECKNYSSVIGDIDTQSVAIISISCNELQKKLSSSCIKETVSLLSKKDDSGYSSYSVGEVQGLLLSKGFPKDIVNECLIDYLRNEYLVL